jgi:YfiR/HmsC-like
MASKVLKVRSLLSLPALVAQMLMAGAVPMTPVGLPLNGGANRFADGAARTVQSLLEFSRWPSRPNPVRLCVIGTARHAEKLTDLILSGGRPVVRRNFPANADAIGTSCDALYIGKMALPAIRQVTARVRGAAVVTIAEDDPGCRSEAMFCLQFEPSTLSFLINVDAVSRSAVRVDPRVLRMSKGGY